MPFDYETLRIIWWILLGVLLIGFAVMDGFDLGVAMWLPWLTRTNMERRILINCVGPTWEGNQVWFILGGGAIFAAWPALYALSFSGFYYAMLLVLLALIMRPVAFKYRSKVDNNRWRSCWDLALFISGIVPALIFGVAVGNVLQGVPFHFDTSLRPFYTGTFINLLNPFALLCGFLSVTMLAMHGAFFINTKTVGHIQSRASKAGCLSALLTSILFLIGGYCMYHCVDGYVIQHAIPHDGPSNPLYKSVIKETAAWLNNYSNLPWITVVPIGSIVMTLLAIIIAKKPVLAFICSGFSVAGIIATVGLSMFPFILPSSSNPGQSLTVWDSSSSKLTLEVMLISTIIFLPIVLTYTAWVYRVLRGKVTEETINYDEHTAY